MVGRAGFEPAKALSQQIYSLPRLATPEPTQFSCDARSHRREIRRMEDRARGFITFGNHKSQTQIFASASRHNFDRFDHDPIHRVVVAVSGTRADLIERIQPFDDVPEDGVLAIELRLRF
jgi:hypothetical protein